MEQMTMFKIPKGERTDLIKRRWENAFQKWSDEHGMQEDCIESWGRVGMDQCVNGVRIIVMAGHV